MKKRFLLPDKEKNLRIMMTDPALHAWVAANAGSGKTTILGNRVIRMLLARQDPGRILCLTFTKAAASEMQNRIFAELTRWVNLDDAALAEAITRLLTTEKTTGEAQTSPPRQAVAKKDLDFARTLFARAMEVPGGLKIQTIHAFAERILRLFPLESGVPVDFNHLDEVQEAELMRRAYRETLTEAGLYPASALGLALGQLIPLLTENSFTKTLEGAIAHLQHLALRGESLPAFTKTEAVYRTYFELEKSDTLEKLVSDFQNNPNHFNLEDCLTLTQILDDREASKAQKELRQKLLTLMRRKQNQHKWLDCAMKLFLTGKGEVSKRSFLSKELAQQLPHLATKEKTIREILPIFLEKRHALETLTRSQALGAIAQDVLKRYNLFKKQKNALSFNDMIAKLRALLLSGHVNWVNFKLDSRIDHILVDEAQDTTPEMWDIIRAIADEFFAGEGQSRKNRSLFVVGDEKQSIYSFQGADPEIFEQTRRFFAHDREEAEHIRYPIPLRYSFRSAPEILEAVDCIFATPDRAEGLSAWGEAPAHISAILSHPGLVELWPLERNLTPKTRDKSPEKEQKTASFSSNGALAHKIAEKIADWRRIGARHLSDNTPILPKDIIILVQKRNSFFYTMLRALKRKNIPVAGADRMILQDELIIEDLLVIAEVALLSDNDLGLATALKTPLFGLNDAQIERLARGRKTSLYYALLEAAKTDIELKKIVIYLEDLHKKAKTEPPFVFFSHILITPSCVDPCLTGRAAFLTRLGPDAREPIQDFLTEALRFTRQNAASLFAFVENQRKLRSSLKREMQNDQQEGEGVVRVMTVHGAKGLEGRIVFLADSHNKPDAKKAKDIFLHYVNASAQSPVPLLLWAGGRQEEPTQLRLLRQEERHKTMLEYRRQLYVALTRAADRLYIAGCAPQISKKEIESGVELPDPEEGGERSWYQLIRKGLAEHPRILVSRPEENLPEEDRPEQEKNQTTEKDKVVLKNRRKMQLLPPDFAQKTVDREERPQLTPAVIPSFQLPAWVNTPPAFRLKTATNLFSPSDYAAPQQPENLQKTQISRLRGKLIHHLLEVLSTKPRDQLEGIARDWLLNHAFQTGQNWQADDAQEAESTREELIFLASRAVKLPALERFFSPNARAEIALAGEITLSSGEKQRISGRIDRFVSDEKGIALLEIKTGKRHMNLGYWRQIACYHALLQQIYPQQPIEAMLFWVDSGVVDAATPELLRL